MHANAFGRMITLTLVAVVPVVGVLDVLAPGVAAGLYFSAYSLS